MKRACWYHWPWLLITAAFTESVITRSWGWMAVCCACIALQLWWWTWTGRREQRAITEAAITAAATERRRRAHTRRRSSLTAAERVEWTSVLAASYTAGELAELEARQRQVVRVYEEQR